MLRESSLIHAPKTVLAIDPGMSGAVALIGRGAFAVRRDFQSLGHIAHAVDELTAMAEAGVDLAVIEYVHAMPHQGVTSMFNFGAATGAAKAAMALCLPETPAVEVSPQEWQNFFRGALAIERSAEFDSRLIAQRVFTTFPDFFQRKKDHNTADAVLLGVWGLSKVGVSVS